MDIDTAREVAKAGFRSASHLGDLLPLLQKSLPPDDYARYRHDIAKLIATVMNGTVDEAIRLHPSLHAEIDAAIASTGSYR